jgi:AcrR family transcriptional regulator
MSAVDLRAETRAYGRARLRELALDAARRVVLERGWAAVRMGAVASEIGISRQSLHGEFGTKDDLGNALVLRETAEFFEGVAARFADHPGDLSGAVSDAAHYMVCVARDNPLLGTILTRTPADGDTSLLSLFTVRGETLLETAYAVVREWVTEQWPDADPADVRLMVESVVRLCQSHILTPTRTPAEVGADLALVATRCLPLPG